MRMHVIVSRHPRPIGTSAESPRCKRAKEKAGEDKEESSGRLPSEEQTRTGCYRNQDQERARRALGEGRISRVRYVPGWVTIRVCHDPAPAMRKTRGSGVWRENTPARIKFGMNGPPQR
jgi:hypothetical protein